MIRYMRGRRPARPSTCCSCRPTRVAVDVTEEGDQSCEVLTVHREDFWAATSNEELNFVQHVRTILKIGRRAALIVPDNVLFEGGADENVRRALLNDCNVHTLLRLPTGIFYAQGVKANVLLFEKREASKKPWTDKLALGLRPTDKHPLHPKNKRLERSDLEEFVACYKPGEL